MRGHWTRAGTKTICTVDVVTKELGQQSFFTSIIRRSSIFLKSNVSVHAVTIGFFWGEGIKRLHVNWTFLAFAAGELAQQHRARKLLIFCLQRLV